MGPGTSKRGAQAAMKALDLFCGAGGATLGLMQTRFAVTGVDSRPQPRYCGDAFVQADALEYLASEVLSRFDFVWASPPCQRFTALKTAPGAKGDARASQAIGQALVHLEGGHARVADSYSGGKS
jgi:site-specific DNA-cytosine methylase